MLFEDDKKSRTLQLCSSFAALKQLQFFLNSDAVWKQFYTLAGLGMSFYLRFA